MEKAAIDIQAILGNIEKLTHIQKLVICISTFIILIGAFTYFSYLPKYKKIDSFKQEFKTISKDLKVAKKNAREIKGYREKLAAKQAQFNEVMRALPDKNEIPSLVSSISQAGLDAGLEFALFQPKAEKNKSFYAEIPISIKVNGGYHNVAMFFDKVSRLPRIVNLDNIKISSSKSKIDNRLSTSCTALTYKFISPSKNKKKKDKKK